MQFDTKTYVSYNADRLDDAVYHLRRDIHQTLHKAAHSHSAYRKTNIENEQKQIERINEIIAQNYNILILFSPRGLYM